VAHQLFSFCFAELHTPEPQLASRFYEGLLHWTTRQRSANYWTFELGERTVVGMRRAATHQWVSYVHVADPDAVAARAASLGAVVQPGVHEPGIARTRLFTDAEGALVGLWLPDGVEGTAVDSGPGSLWWIELAARDMVAARSFYASVFDWDIVHTMQFENSPRGYTLFKRGDRSVAGAFQFEPEWGLTPMWQPFFEVEDFRAAVTRACAHGGEDGFWRDVPRVGRIGVIVDPGDASFIIVHPLAAAG
jgi:uncharacterized protein